MSLIPNACWFSLFMLYSPNVARNVPNGVPEVWRTASANVAHGVGHILLAGCIKSSYWNGQKWMLMQHDNSHSHDTNKHDQHVAKRAKIINLLSHNVFPPISLQHIDDTRRRYQDPIMDTHIQLLLILAPTWFSHISKSLRDPGFGQRAHMNECDEWQKITGWYSSRLYSLAVPWGEAQLFDWVGSTFLARNASL